MKVLKRLFMIILGITAAIYLYACVDSGTREKQASLGEEFNLALGETIAIEQENFTMHFEEFAQDDRCPTRADCECAGQALLVIEVIFTGGEPALLKFNTSPWPDTNLQSIAYSGYVFELVRLDPYPEHPNKPINFEDYRAVMVVRDELNKRALAGRTTLF